MMEMNESERKERKAMSAGMLVGIIVVLAVVGIGVAVGTGMIKLPGAAPAVTVPDISSSAQNAETSIGDIVEDLTTDPQQEVPGLS